MLEATNQHTVIQPDEDALIAQVAARLAADPAAAADHLRRIKARRNLLDFMAYCWRTPAEPLVVGRHTRRITERLNQALAGLAAGQSSRLLIDVPFRHGKSDAVSRYFPPYALGINPDLEIMLVTYVSTLSEAFSRDARSILSSPEYGALFPASALDPSTSSVAVWGIKGRKGKMQASGLSGGITGKGANILIVDDPFSGREDAESETIREKTWLSFVNDALSRLAPVSLVILIGTRWHVDDLHGRIIERMGNQALYPDFPQYEHLHFRAREEDGSYLFPERFSEEWYRAQFSTLGQYAAAALLQGEPTRRGGNMLAVDKIRFVQEFPPDLLWVRFWDLASSAKERAKDDPDATSGARVAYSEPNGAPTCYIGDVRWLQAEAPARNRFIIDTAKGDGGACWQGVEQVAGYKDTVTTLEEILRGFSVVHGIPCSRDKIICAGEIEPVMEAGGVVMLDGPWRKAVVDQLREFPSGKHDDIVDSITKGFALARERWRQYGQFGGKFGDKGAV
jgi:predicted phage terminase large subunit-like protein